MVIFYDGHKNEISSSDIIKIKQILIQHPVFKEMWAREMQQIQASLLNQSHNYPYGFWSEQIGQVLQLILGTAAAVTLYFRLVAKLSPNATEQELNEYNQQNDRWIIVGSVLAIMILISNWFTTLIYKERERRLEVNQKSTYQTITQYLNRLPQVNKELELKKRVFYKLNLFFQNARQGLSTILSSSVSTHSISMRALKPWSIQTHVATPCPSSLKDFLASAFDALDDLEVYNKIDHTLQELSYDQMNIVVLDVLKVKFEEQYKNARFTPAKLKLNEIDNLVDFFIQLQNLAIKETEYTASIQWAFDNFIQVMSNRDKLLLFSHSVDMFQGLYPKNNASLNDILKQVEHFSNMYPTLLAQVAERIPFVKETASKKISLSNLQNFFYKLADSWTFSKLQKGQFQFNLHYYPNKSQYTPNKNKAVFLGNHPNTTPNSTEERGLFGKKEHTKCSPNSNNSPRHGFQKN